MSRHPVNLLVRFALEMVALVALGRWGWTAFSGGAGVAAGLLAPAVAAAAWGTFRVSDDGGPPVVTVTGRVRLLLEVAFFSSAVWAGAATGDGRWALPLGVAVGIHYIVSWDRVGHLARDQPLTPPADPGGPLA